MAIDPTVITTQNVGSLPTSPINLTDIIPHEVGGYLKQSTIEDLAVFIASYVGAASALVFNTTKVTTGQTLPATSIKEFIFIGAGTFPNVGGGAAITTTQGLNVLTSNGSFWTLSVEVPVTVTFNGLVQTIRQGFTGTVTSEGALFDALELIKADVIKSAPFLGAIKPTDTPTGTIANYWLATQAGTYTNFGGVVVNTNSFAVISRDAEGVFSISQTALDLTEYAKSMDFRKFLYTPSNMSAFPYLGIVDLEVLEGSLDLFYRNGVLKDLYFTFLRFNGDGYTSNIIQIGENYNGNLGVSQNVFVEGDFSFTLPNGLNSFILKNNNGLKLKVTFDHSLLANYYNLTNEVRISTAFLANQAKYLDKREFINPDSTFLSTNFAPFKEMRVINGSPELFYNGSVLKDLYLVFVRGNRVGDSGVVIQIGEKIGSSVGVNENILVDISSDTQTTVGTLTHLLEKNGIRIELTIDWSLLPSDLNLTTQFHLNTQYFVNECKRLVLKNTLAGKKIVCFGDSVTEFGNYPELISRLTGAETYKIGFGGCRMGLHSVNYNELSMHELSNAIASQNFTAQDTAVANLIAIGDDNSAALNRLKSIDFSKIDIVTIFFGTNDFTGLNTIGSGINEDVSTIKGAVNVVIRRLLNGFPHLKILFITPTHRFFGAGDNQDSDIVSNDIGLFLKEYADAINTQANLNHIPVLDMYSEGGLNKFNHAYYFGTDGVHPNLAGYTYIAEKISGKIKTL